MMKHFLSVCLALIAFSLLPGLCDLSAQKSGNHTISSSFDPASSSWHIAWPGRVSQYDLVLLSPPVDPMQGIPLGNGETGVLFWCEDSRLIAAVNKSDLWDDAAFGPFHNWSSKEEDYSTTLRHACRIIFDFKQPVFNALYVSGFKARLNIADGSMEMEASSPFGKVEVKAFVDHRTGIIFFDLHSDLKEDLPVDISVERYGSRTFSHWYSLINSDASVGLSGTEAHADAGGAYITQKLSSGIFAAGGRVIESKGVEVTSAREHSRCSSIKLSGREKNCRLAFTVTSPLNADPLKVAQETLNTVARKGIDSYAKSSSDEWRSIWERSFIDYGDDYLNALWHLSIFYANASQGGKYPGRFNNGIWSWDRDVQNWNFYFHWNQQELCWPLNAIGLHELADPYFDFRFRSLPIARKDAHDIFNADGAFISDVTERRGYNSGSENTNHTPVAEIALDFWKQYRYTGDRKFLEEKALPFILDAARYFGSLFQKENDGLYHAKQGTGYEGWIMLRDGLTELVYARKLFSTALEALKESGKTVPEASGWTDILNHLAPLPTVQAGQDAIAKNNGDFILQTGYNKGNIAPGDTIFAAGWGLQEKKWLTVYSPDKSPENSGLKLLDGIFPSVPSSPVYPSGLIGLKDIGTEEFKTCLNTTLLYGREVTGWDPVPIVMARLGMKKELETDLNNYPARWQIYCNGWGHWGSEGEVNKDAEMFFRTNNVSDAGNPGRGKFPLPMWPFRHMSMEAMSVMTTAMNESLLQSYDGVIRVFPAFPDNRAARFTLHATGGFVVSAEKHGTDIQWVSIKSISGGTCRIELPWPKALVRSENDKRIRVISGKIAEIKTRQGEKITLVPEGTDPKNRTIVEEYPVQNEKVRYHASGNARIGIPAMY